MNDQLRSYFLQSCALHSTAQEPTETFRKSVEHLVLPKSTLSLRSSA